jgi:hypothetical protein
LNISEDTLLRLVTREVCYVYRLFNTDDELVYVGITGDLMTRFSQHASDKSWWPEVVRHEIWTYKDRATAAAVEFAVIQSVNPKYNTAPGISPDIVLEGVTESLNVVASASRPKLQRTATVTEQRTWIHEQLDSGADLVGADIDRKFNSRSRNGARLLRSVLAEREMYGYEEED